MSKEITFCFGALSDPLEQQANAQGFTLGDKAELLEELGRCMVMGYVHGICTDSQHTAMMNKLHKKIMKALKPIKTEEE